MLLLYYTSVILLSLGFKASENGLDQNTDTYDRKYLPQYICIADCVQQLEQQQQQEQQQQHQQQQHHQQQHHQQQHQQQEQQQLYNKSKSSNGNHLLHNTNVKFFKICVRYCKQRNAFGRYTNSTRIKQIQENFRLNLICRDDSTLNFRITYEKLSLNNDRQMNDHNQFNNNNNNSSSSSNNNNTSNIIYVIKISKYSNIGEYRIYVSDEMFFTLDKLLPQTIYNITIMAVHSDGGYSIISKQQLFNTLRKSYMPNNIKDIKILKFINHNSHHLSATITWKPGRDMTCFYDIICFSPERQKTDLEPLHVRNPQLLYTYNLYNLDFSTLYKVGIRAKSTRTSRESELYWKSFHTPSCVAWHNYNFNICAPLEPKNLSVQLISVKRHIFALNISWNSHNYLPENYTLWIKDSNENGGSILGKYQLEKSATNFFIPIITLMSDMFEVNLTAFSRGGQTSSIYKDYIKIIGNDQSCMITTLMITILILFCIIILCSILIHNYRYQMKLKKKHPHERKQAQKSLTMDMSVELKLMTTNNRNNAVNVDCKFSRLCKDFSKGTFALIKPAITVKNYRSALSLTVPRNQGYQEFGNVNKFVNITSIIGSNIQIQKCLIHFSEYYHYDNLANYFRYHNNNSIEINNQLKLKQIEKLNQLDKSEVINDPFGYEYCTPIDKMMNTRILSMISVYSTYKLNKPSHGQNINFRKLCTHSGTKIHDEPDRINAYYIDNELMPNFMKSKQIKIIDLIHVAKQMAIGKKFLIQHKILQHDLDAFNILITFYGAIKIADFKQ